MVDGVLDALPELLLDGLETTDILPTNVGNLDNGNLAEGRGIGDTESEAEVLLGNTKRVKDFGVDGILIKVNEIHLLTNLLHGSLGAEGSNIGTNVTVGLGSNLLKIDVIAELHVLGVDLENLETAGRVGDADINLTIETTETTESGIDRVGTVGGSHDNDVGTGLHAIHEGKKLGDDATLHFAVGLVTLGGNRVNLIDEDDGGRVLLSLLEGLAQIRLRLTSHLGHDLGAVDQEEEGTSLVGDGASHQSLTSTRGAIKQDTTGRLDTNGLEKLRMPEGQFNHFADLGHLLTAATDIIVADLIKVVLLLVTLDGLAFAVDDGILSDNTILWWVDLDNLELDLPHTAADNKEIALPNRAVGLAEVGSKEDVEEGSGDAFNGIGDRKDGDTLGLRENLCVNKKCITEVGDCFRTNIFDIRAGVDGDNVAVLDAEVVANNAVEAGAAIVEIVIGKDNQDSVLSLLSADENGITTEELELLHGVVGEGDNRVIIVDRISNPAYC